MKITTTLLAAILLSFTGVAQANFMNPFHSYLTVEQEQANPVLSFSFDGQFRMFDDSGVLVDDGSGSGFTGGMLMDLSTGAGSASISSPLPFLGENWTVHNFILQASSPDTLFADLYFDWHLTSTHVTLNYSVATNGLGGYTLTTLDCGPTGCDGIPGSPVDNGPFQGFNFTFDGTATPVPAPAAGWLLGSGLLSLIGVARRKVS